MPWIKIPEIEGLVYEPEPHKNKKKKHPCKDCFHCQMCSNTRCSECRKETSECIKGRKKVIKKTPDYKNSK